MSNILVILICIVIIAYKVMTQKPKAQKPAAPKPVIGFPEEAYEEEAETPLREEQPKPRKEPVRYTQQMRKPLHRLRRNLRPKRKESASAHGTKPARHSFTRRYSNGNIN